MYRSYTLCVAYINIVSTKTLVKRLSNVLVVMKARCCSEKLSHLKNGFSKVARTTVSVSAKTHTA